MVNFRKYRSRKKVYIQWSKIAKSNIIEKTKELIAEYQDVECLWNVLSPSYQEKKLRQVTSTNLNKKFDMLGKLFQKQPLTGFVENSVFKI